jgi:aminoglycoside/choline kinase family phosphotransferase
MNNTEILPTALAAFCQFHGRDPHSARPLGGDASARRYFHIEGPSGAEILMDASAELHSIAPFNKIAGILRRAGLTAPEIYHYDAVQGFMLLQDLGRRTMFTATEQGAKLAQLYDHAVDALIHLHRAPIEAECRDLPRFDAARFSEQALLFTEMLPHLGFHGPIDQKGFGHAINGCLDVGLKVPYGLLLRDYHGQNIIWRAEQKGLMRVGLLDFQDAGWGPVTYDLVSLVEDARCDLPATLMQHARTRYLMAFPELSAEAFDISLDVMAAMRHLRILAVFARLAQNGKPAYLRHMVRVHGQLERHLSAPCLKELRDWLHRHPIQMPLNREAKGPKVD